MTSLAAENKEAQSLAAIGPLKAKISDDNRISQIQSAHQHIHAHHGQGSDGYIGLSRKHGGQFRTRCYRLEEITHELLSDYLAEGGDLYFTQQTFLFTKRWAKYVRQIRSLYVDLDVYNAGRGVADTVYDLMANHFDKTMPHPNRIVESGRGIQLVWDIVPEREYRRDQFAVIQDYLIGQCAKYGADPTVRDLARVLRLGGSINSKSGSEVKVHYEHDHKYDLMDLVERYVPAKAPRPRREIAWSNTTKLQPDHPLYSHRKSIKTLFMGRVTDILRISNLRAGECTGMRHMMIFLTRYFVLLFTGGDDAAAIKAADNLNSSFTEPLTLTQLERESRSAIRYYDEWAEAWQDKEQGGLWYKNETLISTLEITPEEQIHMATIIGKVEAKRRDRVRHERTRRAAGGKPMDQYQQDRKDEQANKIAKIQEAAAANPGISANKLAGLVGVTPAYISKLKKSGLLSF